MERKVKPRTKKEIWAVVEEVEKQFPFENYITFDAKEQTANLIACVLEAVGDLSNLRLLDVGSGPMNVTAAFSKCGFNCFAVDDLSDPWHLRDDNRAKIQEFARLMNIEFHQQDASYHIPFDRGTFDVVLLKAVIEHLHESPRRLLNECFEFLKPGGALVVTMPNSVNLRKGISVLLGKTNFPPVDQFYHSEGMWRGHVREYTLAETEYILKEGGGEIILSKMVHSQIYSKIPSKILRQIYRILSAIIPTFRDAILVIARKPW